jgi:hypothetical protein
VLERQAIDSDNKDRRISELERKMEQLLTAGGNGAVPSTVDNRVTTNIETQINNTYVTINKFGQEELGDGEASLVSKGAVRQILAESGCPKAVESAIVDLIWANPAHPRNRTVRTANVKDRTRLKVSIGGGEWEVRAAPGVVAEMRQTVLKKIDEARFVEGPVAEIGRACSAELVEARSDAAYFGAAAANAAARPALQEDSPRAAEEEEAVEPAVAAVAREAEEKLREAEEKLRAAEERARAAEEKTSAAEATARRAQNAMYRLVREQEEREKQEAIAEIERRRARYAM